MNGTMEGRILVSRQDALRLRSLIMSERLRRGQDREHLADLEHELDRASMVDGGTLPRDRVALGSTVIVRDADSGVCRVYSLVLPSQADAGKGRISILAPLGTALLGHRAGERVEWQMPGGLSRLKIEAVRP
jgi:regulator of nucleoside diphosphate kinase